MATIELDAVKKRFGSTKAIDSVSLTVKDKEILGLVGPSGCGKTTTLRTIAGFESPDAGRVLFDGEDVTRVPPDRRNIGLLFQSYALFNNMNVLDNITFGLKMQGMNKDERVSRARKLLRMLEISDLEERNPRQLSGGQQQRVGLARALAPEPQILLLDEPMTGLDAKLKRQLRPELGGLLDELEITTLYVTHDQQEAMAMCDRIAVMDNGVIEQIGEPTEIYEHPANEFVADFIGTTNLLTATARNNHLDLGFTRIKRNNGDISGNVTVVARPEAFSVGEGQIPVTISDVFYLGERVEAIAEIPNGDKITIYPEKDIQLRKGQDTRVNVDTNKIHILTG